MLGTPQTTKSPAIMSTSTVTTLATAASQRARLEHLRSLLARAALYSSFLAQNLTARQSEQRAARSQEPSSTSSSETSSTQRQPALVRNVTMKEHQLVGLEWLVSLYENGLSGILGDEMGLGKTLQCAAFLAHLWQVGTRGPFLIVVPLSTLPNWMAELARFIPDIPTLMYRGDKPAREQMRALLKSTLRKGSRKPCPIVVTTYEIAMNDSIHLQNIAWKFIIVDEGHRLKNLDCKLIRELKTYRSANRLLLTGTPLQNNLSELYSLLNFIMPEVFGDKAGFEELFSTALEFASQPHTTPTSSVDDETNDDGASQRKALALELDAAKVELVNQLHGILKPFLLRRVKSEVDLNLPPKREYVIYAPLISLQRRLYAAAIKGTSVLRSTLLNVLETSTNVSAIKKLNSGAVLVGSKRKRAEEGTYREITDAEYFRQLDADDEREEEQRNTTRRLRNKSVKGNNDDDSDEDNDNGVLVPTDVDAIETHDDIIRLLNSQNLRNTAMQLRKVCNHPYLFGLDVLEDYDSDDDNDSDDLDDKDTAVKRRRSSKNGKVNKFDAKSPRIPRIALLSGKMLLLERLLPKLFEKGHKVLIFTQMTRMLDIIGHWCTKYKGWEYGRIDGNVSMDDRREQIDRFNSDDSIRLFLLSSRAGGLGVNLTAADTVIIFDSDWNPQCDLQAQDRIHRIGQTRPCLVYRLATENTIEQRILDRANDKRKLERLVIHKELFKGRTQDYTESRVFSEKDLVAALKEEEAQFVKNVEADEDATFKEGSKVIDLNSYKTMMTTGSKELLESVLSDTGLARIMNRSPEAYQNHTSDNVDGEKYKLFETPVFKSMI